MPVLGAANAWQCSARRTATARGGDGGGQCRACRQPETVRVGWPRPRLYESIAVYCPDVLPSVGTTSSFAVTARSNRLVGRMDTRRSRVKERVSRTLARAWISGSEAIMPVRKTACQTFCSGNLPALHLSSNATRQSVREPLVNPLSCDSLDQLHFHAQRHVFLALGAIGLPVRWLPSPAPTVESRHGDPFVELA